MALLAGAAYFGLAFWVREPARALLALPASIGAGLLVLAAFWSGHYWAVALTDRRLLVRRDFPWRAPYEIPRSEVESVRMDSAAYKIRIRGGRQEIAVDPMRVGYAELKRLLGLAGEAAP
ncbi:MAG: hypothetical protein OEZ03_13010 [Alphaproteobacteria bacterium]|nr:hypothetical protein [Alphaproteobacteria bacterium]